MKNSIEYNLSIEYTLKYEQYRDKDIYLYKIESKSSFINGLNGYTNKEGIDKLLNGNGKIKTFNYSLLSDDMINEFRNQYFDQALEKIENMKKIDEFNLNDNKYSLYLINWDSHSIFDINGNLLPKFLPLNNPLYLINNNDFDLNKVLNIVANDERFIYTGGSSIYEKNLLSNNNFHITNIPYYNQDDEKNTYLNIGFVPTNEDWKKLINVVQYNNLMKENGYIHNLSVLALKLGIIPLEFKDEKSFDFVTKDLIINENDLEFDR